MALLNPQESLQYFFNKDLGQYKATCFSALYPLLSLFKTRFRSLWGATEVPVSNVPLDLKSHERSLGTELPPVARSVPQRDCLKGGTNTPLQCLTDIFHRCHDVTFMAPSSTHMPLRTAIRSMGAFAEPSKVLASSVSELTRRQQDRWASWLAILQRALVFLLSSCLHALWLCNWPFRRITRSAPRATAPPRTRFPLCAKCSAVRHVKNPICLFN